MIKWNRKVFAEYLGYFCLSAFAIVAGGSVAYWALLYDAGAVAASVTTGAVGAGLIYSAGESAIRRLKKPTV